MDTNRENLMTLILIFAITALSLLVWLVILFLVWLVLHLLGFYVDFFAMVESLSTAITAAAVFSAGFIAYRELNEGSNTRYMEVADRLFSELNSEENIAARRWIYQNLPENPQDGLVQINDEGHHAIKKVLNSLDRVAFLTQKDWIPDKMVMPWMSPMVLKSWCKLEPYVDYEAQRRNEPGYYQLARKLAARCKAWDGVNNSKTNIIWVDDAL